MKNIRRLCVSLDGTWNNRDDSTNVLHGHSLTYECQDHIDANGNRVTQQRYYQEGVGTGPLDRITGGGFGFGLEEHVRGAYNWLVQNFEDGNGTADKPPDEIYIFGFSRGAYTARSLVGFINMCGLLRRGAPMTVNQLWKNYCILGLELEERNGGIADKIFGQPKAEFRRISNLIWDPWHVKATVPVPAGHVPGQRQGITLNSTEELLVRWSRRIKITYLGVYDTVGAMGWDALSIPGLRSKLAVHHNMRPTLIVQKCRHALAMDEHRSSFRHTPFVAYIGVITSAAESDGILAPAPAGAIVGSSQMSAEDWRDKLREWEERIEQRWFVGAHSNIGGGYPDNRLARRPLEWILEGARDQGLICEKLSAVPTLTPAQTTPWDSFAEFAAPLWTMVFRAKRNYRAILPRPELRANRDEAKNKGEVRAGFSLVNIHETVDETVLDYWKNSESAPVNLIECASKLKNTYPARAAELDELTVKVPVNVWPGEGCWPQFGFVLWAAFASGGFAIMSQLFCVSLSSSLQLCLLCILAVGFPIIDWAENSSNSSLSKRGIKPWPQAFLDSIYWIRLLGVVLFVVGVFGTALFLWRKGWYAHSAIEAGRSAFFLMLRCGLVSVCAAVGVLLVNWGNKSWHNQFGRKFLAIVSAPIAAVVLIPLVIIGAQVLGSIVNAALGINSDALSVSAANPDQTRVAGLLLLLELAFAYFLRAFVWVGEPTAKANLGSITALQKTCTPLGVKLCLDRWCKMLGDHHNGSNVECAMTGIIRQALWRDIFGFIPLYSLLMLFGLWFGAKQLEWEQWWAPLGYLWFVVPFVAAGADYLEDCCHLRYLFLHSKGTIPGKALTWFSFSMTQIKNVAFVVGTLMVGGAILCAIGKFSFSPQQYGWRGLIAIILTCTSMGTVSVLWIWGRLYKFLNSR